MRNGWKRVLALIAAMAPGAGNAAWMEASSDHFLVYGDMSPERIREFAERLERFDRAIRTVIPGHGDTSSPSNRVTIYVLGGTTAVERLCGKDKGCSNVAGMYMPRASGPVAFTPIRSGGGAAYELNAQTVLFHEYAHHVVMGSREVALPRWLNEGLAEFASTAKINPDGGVEIGHIAAHRAYALMVEAQMPTATLLDADRLKLTGSQVDQLYSRGWLLTHNLTFSPARRGQLDAYVGQIAQGVRSREAGEKVFGDLKVLDRELEAYKNKRGWSFLAVPADRLKIGAVAVRPMRPGEAAIMPYRMRSERGVDAAMAAALAAQAAPVAAAFPQDPWVQRVLAEIEYDAGHDDAAEAAADRAIAADPKAIEALLYKGRVRARRAAAATNMPGAAARWQEARSWLVRANQLEPDRAYPLVLYYDSFRAAGMPPGDDAKRGLARAAELVPQDMSIHARLGQMYLQDGKFPEARAALALVAFSPHVAPDIWAAKLIARIDAGDDAAAIAADPANRAAPSEIAAAGQN